jgi:uncharacterized protein with ACT and thioredoxin-like domain
MLKVKDQNNIYGGRYIILDDNTQLFLAKVNPTVDEINDFLISIERESLDKIDILGEENDI